MRVLITKSGPHHGKVGEIVGTLPSGEVRVRIPNRNGSVLTVCRDQDYKPTKIQPDDKAPDNRRWAVMTSSPDRGIYAVATPLTIGEAMAFMDGLPFDSYLELLPDDSRPGDRE